jgi:hypothetical protein
MITILLPKGCIVPNIKTTDSGRSTVKQIVKTFLFGRNRSHAATQMYVSILIS